MICQYCGRNYLGGEMGMELTSTGSYVCHTCIEQHREYIRRCVVCDRYVFGSTLCTDCYNDGNRICVRCSAVVSCYEIRQGVCPDCMEEYQECAGCGYLVHHNDVMNGMCERCYSRTIIHPFDYRPKLTFHGGPPLFFGVELEIECPHSTDRLELAGALLKTIKSDGIYWLMNDSSLDYGYEIGTHPCSLHYHQTEFPWLKLLSWLRKTGHASEEPGTCGLHVHLSKLALTLTQQMQIQYFVHDQYDLMWTLARRKGGEYAKFLDKKLSRHDLPLNTPDRHEAVNLSNRDTVEIRIFRGTLEYHEVLSAIEMCHAIVEYVRTVNFNALKLRNKARIDFIQSILNNKQYHSLPAYIHNLGIV